MKRALIAGLMLFAAAGCARVDTPAEAAQQLATCQTGPFDDQRMAACTAVVTAAVAEPQQRVAALIARGIMRRDAGEHARAVADFGRALRINNTSADAYIERGLVHAARGAFELAVRDYDAALRIDPSSSLAAYHREEALRGRVDSFRQQLDQLDQVIAQDPRNAGALNNRCWLRAINNDDMNAALADCNAGLAIQPGESNLLDSRGLVHLKRSEFDAALADYEAALAAEPQRGHFLYGRGIAQIRLGKTAEGQADLAAAEQAEPGVTALYASYGVTP